MIVRSVGTKFYKFSVAIYSTYKEWTDSCLLCSKYTIKYVQFHKVTISKILKVAKLAEFE